MITAIKNNSILQRISLLCWLFLFYIPIFNQLQTANSQNQQVAICTLAGIKFIDLGTPVSTVHTNIDCPCVGQSIAHQYKVITPQNISAVINIDIIYQYYSQHRSYRSQAPRAPPIS